MAPSTFKLPSNFTGMSHRERIMAKRELYGADLRYIPPERHFTNEEAKHHGLPYQGAKECARRLAAV